MLGFLILGECMKSIFVTLMLAFSSAVFAGPQDFNECRGMFANGKPPELSAAYTRPVCYEAFAVLHSGETRTPLYSAEKLNRERLLDAKGEQRTDEFFADARLPRSERAELEDYKRSGFDRGHLAPAADMPTSTAMAQSFSLANIVPQASENNRNQWADIEKATRKYVMRARGDVFVITGAVFNGDQSIGANQVKVPTYLYKLVYDATTKRAWAHWIENRDDAKVSKPISYYELVVRTGIKFLPNAEIVNK
jgi:endonuclease G